MSETGKVPKPIWNTWIVFWLAGFLFTLGAAFADGPRLDQEPIGFFTFVFGGLFIWFLWPLLLGAILI